VLESQRGNFDWSFSDLRIEACEKLGINLLLDVMHFGTPLWLKQAVGDPEFPRRWKNSPRRSSRDTAAA